MDSTREKGNALRNMSTFVEVIAGLSCIFVASRGVAWLWHLYRIRLTAQVQSKFDWTTRIPNESEARSMNRNLLGSFLIQDIIRLAVVFGVCYLFAEISRSTIIWTIFALWSLIRRLPAIASDVKLLIAAESATMDTDE
jgi:hypothetical protein